MSLAAIALDRYFVINCPLKMCKASRSQSLTAIGLIWLYSVVFASMPFFGLGKYVPEGYLTSCSFDYLSEDTGTRIFILIFFIAAWMTPFLIIISCYSAIFRYAVKVQNELNLGNPQDNHRLSYRHSSTLASTSSGN
jgi:r-opsin